MWVENGDNLIALEGRDIKLECREIVFDGGRRIEVMRHQSPQIAKSVYDTIVKRLREKGEII